MPRDREAESNSKQESRHSGHRDQRDHHRRDEHHREDHRRDDYRRDDHQRDSRARDRSRSRHDDKNHVTRIKSEPPDKGYENRRASNREDREDRRQNDKQRVQDRNKRSEEQQHWGRDTGERQVKTESKPKEKPNMELSGKLAEDTNIFKGVVIKYNEPPEARKPKRKWRLYPFKGDEQLPMLHIHRQSAFLLGRDRRIADIPIDHPSCSKQHAVFQFRMVSYERPDGTQGRHVKPYIIDLGSANGSFVNGKQIEPQRYVELFEKDVLKFGFSSREYVLMHDAVTMDEGDDDGVAGAVSPEPATKGIKKEESND